MIIERHVVNKKAMPLQLMLIFLACPLVRAEVHNIVNHSASGTALRQLYDRAGKLRTGFPDKIPQPPEIARQSEQGDLIRLALYDRALRLIELPQGAYEQATIKLYLERSISTQIGRERIQRFVEENTRIAVGFEEIPGTQIATVGTKKYVLGSGGRFYFAREPMALKMNKAYLETGQIDKAVGVFAHEFLGHGLSHIRFKKAGLNNAYGFYHNNEIHAGLVGWVMDLELGLPPEDKNMWDYIKDPEGYIDGLLFLEGNATLLNHDEAQDLPGVYRERLARLPEIAKKAIARRKRYEEIPQVVQHFVVDHGMDMREFPFVLSKARESAQYSHHYLRSLLGIRQELQNSIAYFSGPDGAGRADQFRSAYSHPLFAELEADRKQLTQRLKAALEGKTRPPLPYLTSPPGMMSLEDFKAMVESDRADHPRNYPN